MDSELGDRFDKEMLWKWGAYQAEVTGMRYSPAKDKDWFDRHLDIEVRAWHNAEDPTLLDRAVGFGDRVFVLSETLLRELVNNQQNPAEVKTYSEGTS